MIYLAIPLASLFGAIVAGFFGKAIGRAGAHLVTIAGVGTSFVLSLMAFNYLVLNGGDIYNETVYTWMVSDGLKFEIGFLDGDDIALLSFVLTTSLITRKNTKRVLNACKIILVK